MPSSAAPGPREAARPRVATPTDVSAAIEARRQRETRHRRMVLAGVIGLLLLALLAVWLVRFSPVLSARTVEVRGTSRLTSSQVSDAAQVPLGTPLVEVDTRAVAQRVAGALATVRTVDVHTALPDTVVIDVTERTAVYQRRGVNSSWQLVDADGVVFALQAKKTAKLPVVTTTSVDNRVLAGVASVVTGLPSALRNRLQEVVATSADQITLKLDKGVQVLWGSADDTAVKGQVVTALLAGHATWIDVSSPGTPVTR